MQSLICKCLGLSGCQFVTCLRIFSRPWLQIFDGLKKGGVSTNRIVAAESAESRDLFCVLGTKTSRVHSPPSPRTTVSLLQLSFTELHYTEYAKYVERKEQGDAKLY